MRVADRVWQVVKAAGVEVVFYVPGGGAAFLVDALGRSGLRCVSMLHEQGAGWAALAYGQLKGLGVVLATSGPGATNCLTPCAAAWVDSAPLLVISGQPNSDTLVTCPGMRTRGVQEVDIIPVVKPITKEAKQPMTGRDALVCLDHMIELAKDGRKGPVWLSVPLDVSAEVIDE